MSKKIDVCICIPVYKEVLSEVEKKSLNQLKKLLGSYTIKFFGPERLSKLYTDFQYEIFNSEYFKGIPGYNDLMLSVEFYRRFDSYNYILIYQLDAYVFKDELNYWCQKGYDYIGAPWFENFATSHQEGSLWQVGNGGFSLRKVDSMIKVLESSDKIHKLRDLFWKLRKEQGFGVRDLYRVYFKEPNSLKKKSKVYPENEDLFWGIEVKKVFEWYKVPDVKEALKFSFECDPEYLYHLNNDKLPFGCHAWEKYSTDFWQEFILND